MFSYITRRFFIAKIQAEIIAQHNDQKFVNTVCQTPEIIETLNVIQQHAYYRKDKNAPFLIACFVLGEGLASNSFDEETKSLCAKLLIQRLTKARGDPHFQMRHFSLFSDLEEKIDLWFQENTIQTP